MQIKSSTLGANEDYAYLAANQFIKEFSVTQALAAAFKMGLIELLAQGKPCALEDLLLVTKADRHGLQCLLGILITAGIVSNQEDQYCLSESFSSVLQYRDFIEAQPDFANFIAADIIDYFPLLLTSGEAFMRQAKLFELFDYDRAIEFSEENLAATRRWVRFTTALTRYEARVCNSHHDFSQYKSMMDIGGNSGEFVLQLCMRNPKLTATVIDLPLVCDVGEEHVAEFREGGRIQFVKADALRHELPKGFDLVSFKSILHDWSEEHVCQFIHNAASSIVPGGRLLIFERGVIDYSDGAIPYYMIPMLLFFRSFREPDLYVECLRREGFVDIAIERLQLETAFYIVTATKPA